MASQVRSRQVESAPFNPARLHIVGRLSIRAGCSANRREAKLSTSKLNSERLSRTGRVIHIYNGRLGEANIHYLGDRPSEFRPRV